MLHKSNALFLPSTTAADAIKQQLLLVDVVAVAAVQTYATVSMLLIALFVSIDEALVVVVVVSVVVVVLVVASVLTYEQQQRDCNMKSLDIQLVALVVVVVCIKSSC